MSMRHVLFLSLFFNGVYASLDSTLISKKRGPEDDHADHADHAHDHDHAHAHEEPVETAERAESDASDGDADQVIQNDDDAAAATAIVAPVTVRSTCTVKRCYRDKHFHIVDEVELPEYAETDGFKDELDLTLARSVKQVLHFPLWKNDDIDFCFQLHQVASKTHYSAYFMKIPANRRYILLVGTVRYADEEEDEHPETHEDACDGKVLITYKLMIDFWKTGDDYTKFPIAPKGKKYIDDYPYTNRRSVVNYREGQWEFEGKLLQYIYKWHDRRAYFVVDATLLELADFRNSDAEPLKDVAYLHKIYTGAKSSVARDDNEFWKVMSSEDQFTDIKDEQRILLFEKRENNRRGLTSKTKGVKWLTDIKEPKASGAKKTAINNALSEKFQYNKPIFLLPIVACGLFPKDFPKPKNCEGVKHEREG